MSSLIVVVLSVAIYLLAIVSNLVGEQLFLSVCRMSNAGILEFVCKGGHGLVFYLAMWTSILNVSLVFYFLFNDRKSGFIDLWAHLWKRGIKSIASVLFIYLVLIVVCVGVWGGVWIDESFSNWYGFKFFHLGCFPSALLVFFIFGFQK